MRRRTLFHLALAAAVVAACAAPTYKPITLAELTGSDGWLQHEGFRYRGAMRDGRPHGRGEAVYPNGMRLTGTFQRGTPEGHATIVVPQWGRIEGTLRGGTLVSGTAYLDDGSRYQGGFAGWQYQGDGSFFDAGANTWLTGAFAQGTLSGPGTLYDVASGAQTSGTFRNGALDGAAIRVTESGGQGVYFDRGREGTATLRPAAAANALADEARAESRAAAAEAQRAEQRRDAGQQEIRRLRTIRQPSGLEAFNKQCAGRCNGLWSMRAIANPDGTVRFEGAGQGCLFIEERDRNITAEERKREEEAYDRRQAAISRECRAWKDDIDDPNMPARIARIEDEHRRIAQTLEAARQRRIAADARAERLAGEARERRFSEEVRRREAEMAAAERRQAAEQAERLRELKERCRNPRPGQCECDRFRPPLPPLPPGRARACEQ